MLIHDLTEKYGPVVREGRVTNVLDAAFDVVVVSPSVFHLVLDFD
jgi:protein SSD1